MKKRRTKRRRKNVHKHYNMYERAHACFHVVMYIRSCMQKCPCDSLIAHDVHEYERRYVLVRSRCSGGNSGGISLLLNVCSMRSGLSGTRGVREESESRGICNLSPG